MQQRIFIINFAVSGALALILISIIRYIGAGITAPLVELSKTMRKAGDGNVDVRATVDGPRDIAGMAKIFNDMISTLQIREEELKNAKNNLEILVAQRTEELQSANQMLAQLAAARKDTLRHATHALRNPMQGLRTTIHVLKSYPDLASEKRLRAINIASSSVEAIHALIERYLRSEEIDSESFRLQMTMIPLSPIIQGVIDLNYATALNKKIAISCNTGKGINVFTDEKALTEVLDNLISNAIKYSPPCSPITINTIVEPTYVRISVLDRGIGVPESDRDKLFTRFGKCLPPTSGEESSGLGLEISRKLSLQIQIQLDYMHREGGGSNFYLTIPASLVQII